MEKTKSISIYTEEEIKDTFETIDSLDDLIVRCYLEELKKDNKKEPDVFYIYRRIIDCIERKAYDVTIGLKAEDVSSEYISNFLVANKFAHNYGVFEVLNPYGKLFTSTEMAITIAKFRNESEDKYCLFEDKEIVRGILSFRGVQDDDNR